MPIIGAVQDASLVEYILYAFMGLNVLLSASIVLHQCVRKLAPAKVRGE